MLERRGKKTLLKKENKIMREFKVHFKEKKFIKILISQRYNLNIMTHIIPKKKIEQTVEIFSY